MEKLNGLIGKAFTFIEKYSILIILGALLILWVKFKDKILALFGLDDESEKEEKEQEKAAVEHNEKLKTPVKKPLPKDPKKKPAVARENLKVADMHLAATVAENIAKYAGYQPFSVASRNQAELNKLAQQMDKFDVSIAMVAKEYKSIDGNDLYKDVRSTMGDSYLTWLKVASKTP